jgi:hypothetical protein
MIDTSDTIQRATGTNYTTWRDTGTIDNLDGTGTIDTSVSNRHDRYKAELDVTSCIGELPV